MQETLSLMLTLFIFVLLLATIYGIELIQCLRYLWYKRTKQPTRGMLTSRGMIVNHILDRKSVV